MQHLSVSGGHEGKIMPGKIISRKLISDPKQEYFLYLPCKRCHGLPIFVTVHGVKRMAREHAREFAPFADRYNVVLVAPLFPKRRFNDYQRLGGNGKSARSDRVLNRIIEEVRFLTGADANKLYMFGYSGGGQFVHRYAMAYPQKVKRIVVAAPGWYTFPDHKIKYPRGIRRTRKLPGITFDPAQFLSIPACVMVGDQDVYRDAELNTSCHVDRQQGLNRLERGRAWIRSMQNAARERNMNTEFDFQILPGCNHSFLKCMSAGRMGERVFKFLFDAS